MKEILFETIDSTNTYLKNNYHKLEDMTFVCTNRQTNGRGRNSHKWDSDENNLLFSLLIKNKVYFSLTNSISIITAYSILEVLKKYKLVDLKIKWPNDVYSNGKKICGILLESISQVEMNCLIIGVGLNVNQKIFDSNYDVCATSMFNELGDYIDVNKLKYDVYLKLEDNLNKLINGYDFYQDIKQYDYLANKDVYAYIGNEKTLVKVKGIDTDYSLKIFHQDLELSLKSDEISFHI